MRATPKRWTQDEDLLLRQYAAKEVTLALVCETTKRTAQAVCSRAHVLGLTKRKWHNRLPKRWERLPLAIQDSIVEKATIDLLPLNAVALEYKITRAEVAEILRSRGIPMAPWKSRKLSKVLKGRVLGTGQFKKRIFTLQELDSAVKLFENGGSLREVSRLLQCDFIVASKILRDSGINVQKEAIRRAVLTRKRNRLSGLEAPQRNGGRGIRVYYDTPFQGRVCLRSRTEAVRAMELDALQVAWFYEVRPFTLDKGTYLPDFWITDLMLQESGLVVGTKLPREEILEFLGRIPHVMEDVKGWYGPRHWSYEKINAFRLKYPGYPFRILILDPQHGVRTWL